jgi:hypothetical protein
MPPAMDSLQSGIPPRRLEDNHAHLPDPDLPIFHHAYRVSIVYANFLDIFDKIACSVHVTLWENPTDPTFRTGGTDDPLCSRTRRTGADTRS